MPPAQNNQSLERGLDAIARAIKTRAGMYWKKKVSVTATGARSTTSTSNVAIPTDGVAITFVKLADTTELFFEFSGAFYLTTNPGRIIYAVNINGVDYDIAVRFKNELSSHAVAHGFLELAGIPAGTYTATLKVRVASGGGQWNMAVGDNVNHLVVEETIPQ